MFGRATIRLGIGPHSSLKQLNTALSNIIPTNRVRAVVGIFFRSAVYNGLLNY